MEVSNNDLWTAYRATAVTECAPYERINPYRGNQWLEATRLQPEKDCGRRWMKRDRSRPDMDRNQIWVDDMR